MEAQTDQELALIVGNELLAQLIQTIANPPDPNAWKTDGLIDWVAKRTKKFHPIRAPLHDHRKTIDRIPWARFGRAHLDPQRLQKVDVPKEIFKHLKRFSQIQARTSSWRASNEDFADTVERLSNINVDNNIDVERSSSQMGIEDPSKGSKLTTMDQPEVAEGKGEPIDETQINGEDVVVLDQHAFDGPDDLGGETDEAKQMEEAEKMAEAMRLAQEKIMIGQMYPWRRSFRQSWRPPEHDHPEDYPARPFKQSRKMGFPKKLKTALFTLMPEPGQDYKLLPVEERESWRLQMPAAQFILECQLLERMMRKINYLNNPRYSREPRTFQALEIYRQKDPLKPLPYWIEIEAPVKRMGDYFHLNPPVVVFDGFGLDVQVRCC